MNAFKKTVLGFALLIVSVMAQSAALAAPSDTTVNGMDPVNFWLFDLDSNPATEVTLSVTSFSGSPGTLWYSYDNAAWSAFQSGNAYTPGQIFLKFNDDTDGDVTFQGGISTTSGDIDLYSGISILWSYGTNWAVSLGSSGTGGIAQTPIPASAFLLLTGIVGLIGFRRHTSKR